MDFSILTPTYKRPDNMEKLCNSIFETMSGEAEIELLFYIEKDDFESQKKIEELKNNEFGVRVEAYNDGKDWYNNWWQYLYIKSSGSLIMLCGDDNVFKTEKWDKTVLDVAKKYEDQIVLINCNDGSYAYAERATHPFVTRKWCETVGYFTTGLFRGGFNDTWFTEIAKEINRFVTLENVLIEHNHPDFEKSSWDPVYDKQKKEVFSQKSWDVFSQTKSKRMEDAEKLKSLMSKGG